MMIDRRIPVAMVREAARAYMEATSGRKAAADIGLSKTGLRAFVAGTDPHPGTLRKLSEWYVRTAAERDEALMVQTAAAALALLTEHLPSGQRAEAERRILGVLEEATKADKVTLPAWLRELHDDRVSGGGV